MDFIGRSEELAALEALYQRDRFEMAVIYGRRRVGKTWLIDRFIQSKQALRFTALQRSDTINRHRFTQAIADFFGYDTLPDFPDWTSAFSFIVKQTTTNERRFVLVFDEFPYAALMAPTLPSELQVAIDRGFNETSTMIILSGSNEGFMESEVLGHRSPLYGRRTAQLHLQPFDYATAAQFLPNTDPTTLVEYYATFGGTPYYLAQLDARAGFEDNVLDLCFNPLGLLREEPSMLLREELREPALYHSVLQSIADGNTKPKIIAEHAGIDPNGIAKYLKTLESLGLVERRVPFGDKPTSRKALYELRDPFFVYWYRFVAPASDIIDGRMGRAAARKAAFSSAFNTYVGQQFERLCMQWLIARNAKGLLPFLGTTFGKWWGNDPRKRAQTDIDAVLADPEGKEILLAECKWRNTFNETEAVESLRERVGLIAGYTRTHLMLFSKHEVSDATKEKYRNQVEFVCADELYLRDGAQ